MSPTRKRYFLRLIGRCIVLAICTALCFLRPEAFDVLHGMKHTKIKNKKVHVEIAKKDKTNGKKR